MKSLLYDKHVMMVSGQERDNCLKSYCFFISMRPDISPTKKMAKTLIRRIFLELCLDFSKTCGSEGNIVFFFLLKRNIQAA